jgi:HEAT repeat protein
MKEGSKTMQTLRLSIPLLALSLLGSSAVHAQAVETREYSRKGEISPNTDAPTLNQMVSAIENGSPERLKATLEYGERVVCEACVPLLERKLLESESPRVREMSAWWLRRQPFAAPALLVKLRGVVKRDGDATRRARAAEALGEFMDAHAVPELTDAVLEDKDASVRKAAVRALARLNGETSFAVFADALGDPDTGVKLATLEVLVEVGAFRDHDALLALLGDKSAEVRTRAARVCGEYRVAEAESALIAMLEGDEAREARKAAAWALGRIGREAGQLALLEAKNTEQDDRVLDAIRVAERMPARF